MKVYLAWDTDNAELLGIYSTREKAMERLKAQLKSNYDEDSFQTLEECIEDLYNDDYIGLSCEEREVI